MILLFNNDVTTMIYKLIHRDYTQLLIKEYNSSKYHINWRYIGFGGYMAENIYGISITNKSKRIGVKLPKRYTYSSGMDNITGFKSLDRISVGFY